MTKEIITDYLTKIEEALNSGNFEGLDYILEYIYTGGLPDEDILEIDDILQEVTLYAELKEEEYKFEALRLISEFK